jgi:DNA segregation ATPase FtsK/SpoIIIE, S-DNA-T family
VRRTREKKQKLRLTMHRRLNEGIFILTLALSLFLLLSLISYHSTDPSWSSTGQTANISNAGGRVGAWIADVLLYSCGYFAFVFPFMLFYLMWLYLREGKNQSKKSSSVSYVKVMGFVLFLLSGAGIASLHIVSSSYLPFSSGGIFGNVVGYSMMKIFNSTGSGLILFTSFLIGFTLVTGCSWLLLADTIGKFMLDNFSRLLKISKQVLQHKTKMKQEPDIKLISTAEEKADADVREPYITPAPPEETDKRLEIKISPVHYEPSLEGTIPPITVLELPDRVTHKGCTNQQLEHMAHEVELRLQDFSIDANVVAVHPGPVVIRFELQLAAGTKVSKITALAKDLARSLSVMSVRIVEIIPGKSVIGLELPNQHREVVRLREVLASQQYENAHSPLVLALGKDIAGHPVIVDLAKMPHLLLAGTTGSGKSVSLNAIILSLLFRTTPKELRLIMIDPKMLEFVIYEGIPHLLAPVVTDMKKAANALKWCIIEMENRYKLMASLGVRNIAGYNEKVKEAKKKGMPLLDPLWEEGVDQETEPLQELPYIVVLIDEFADMMRITGKKVEELIIRIAQKARAAGIHLILATQRPSADVITGLIKANIPTRIAFQVSSKIDSRIILDQHGAEQLLGQGDMLYQAPGTGVPLRIHGAFVADEEVHQVVYQLRRRGRPDYREDFFLPPGAEVSSGSSNLSGCLEDKGQDPLYEQAVKIVIETQCASISNIQRRLNINYNRAAHIIEAMQIAGLVTSMSTNGSRKILIPASAKEHCH